MKITEELKAELAKHGFKYFKIAGLVHFTNSKLKEGLEIKSNHINPYIIDETGKNYSPGKLHEDTELCITIIENMTEIVDKKNIINNNDSSSAHQTEKKINPAKTYIETGELVEYIEETAIVPQNLTNELIVKHPGSLKSLISMQQTAPNMIKIRDGPNGTKLKYVDTSYMTGALNLAFLFDWDFEVIESREDGKMFSVLGRLTVRFTDGKVVKKEQWGSQVQRSNMEIGDTLKGAASDALKKCASNFIARDVYAGEV